MRVVLDTNVMLQARAAGHPYHSILQAWMNLRFSLVVSTEIMLEVFMATSRRRLAAPVFPRPKDGAPFWVPAPT
ncbi:PIN domain-containing protein [Prosthecobacter sp.]|uniref:PIN domain-containing protein n=1 Tax=Prosthecobacter sp. TaxID=1965333 RepID=UPI00378403A2